jgi:hypothetical protein
VQLHNLGLLCRRCGWCCWRCCRWNQVFLVGSDVDQSSTEEQGYEKQRETEHHRVKRIVVPQVHKVDSDQNGFGCRDGHRDWHFPSAQVELRDHHRGYSEENQGREDCEQHLQWHDVNVTVRVVVIRSVVRSIARLAMRLRVVICRSLEGRLVGSAGLLMRHRVYPIKYNNGNR